MLVSRGDPQARTYQREQGMAAVMSPALAHEAVFWFPAVLTLLLVIFVAAIVRSPAGTPSPAGQDAADQGYRQEPGGEPPTGPLPRRVAGQSGRTARTPGELPLPRDVVRAPRVSGAPPWGPAPKPPGLL
jgi:hypothetical protein